MEYKGLSVRVLLVKSFLYYRTSLNHNTPVYNENL